MLRKKAGIPGFVRAGVVAAVLIPVCSTFLPGQGFYPGVISQGLFQACTVLLCYPLIPVRSRVGALGVFLLVLIPASLCPFRAYALFLTSTLPECILFLFRALRLAGSADNASAAIPLWEHTQELATSSLALSGQFLACLCALLVVKGPPAGLIALMPLPAAIISAVLYLRSFSRLSVLKWQPSSGMPYGDSRQTAHLPPSGPSRLNTVLRMVFAKLTDYMEEEKPFLDSGLGIEDVCRKLATNRTYLSRAVNACTGLSFPQYVNSYRIAYAMGLFKRDSRLKVAELASMSGFSSSVTFNIAFRLFKNQTPGQWCDSYRASCRAGEPQPRREYVSRDEGS